MGHDLEMRVAFLVSTLRRTGPVSQLLELVTRLDPDRFEPVVVTLSPEPRDTRWADFATQGAQMVSLGLSRAQGLTIGKKRLQHTLGRLGVQLVHTQGLRPDALMCRTQPLLPHVSTVRNFAYEDYRMLFGVARGHILASMHVAALRRTQCPVACSHHLAYRYQQLGIHMRVVPNGVNTEYYCPQPQEEVRRQLGIAQRARVFVYLGSFTRRKAVDRIIFAFRQLKTAGTPTLLLLVGDGPERPKLEALTEGDSRVCFVGHTDLPEQYLRAADWMVSASVSEGLPNAVLESLACGTPVLLSSIGAHQEIASRAEEACRLFQVSSTEALRDGLRQAMECSDMVDLRAEARGVAVEFFSAAKMAQSYQDLYATILNAGVTA